VAQQRKRTVPNRKTTGSERTARKRSKSGDAPERRASVRRPSSSGPPVIVIVLGGLLFIAALGWGFMSGANSGGSARANIDAARRVMMKGDSLASVETKLGLALSDSDITKSEREEITGLRAELKVRQAAILLQEEHMIGTEYLEKKLRKYSSRNLAGDPDHPKARVFMERCKIFRERWPLHPEMEWVDRNERRFAGMVDLNVPPTWADMYWKLDRLVLGQPKDYAQAFEAVDKFLNTANEMDKTLSTNRRKVMVEERAAYHLDRMKQARFELEVNNSKLECVRLLVYGIVYMGDAKMAAEAADYLLAMDNVVGHLRGYRNDRPLIWDRLKSEPSIASIIRDTPDF